MIGKTISHYHILEKLGEGGMGVVYKAEDIKLKRTVALKFLPHHLLANEEDKTRFLHEAQAASALNHPNIMTIHEIDEFEGEFFIAMECVDGDTLKDKLEKGPLKTKELLNIAIAVADGLNAAHEQEIVHRDIKSENIMISKAGLVKIMDFGLAKRKGMSRITKAGSTLGTLAYMSPEQAEGSDLDRRSDLFSFGVVMYEMATGQLPFKGEHDAAILYSIVNEAPLPVTTLNPNIPQELERIIHKALEKEVEDRYQHADDLAADLKKLKKDLESGRTTTITTQIPIMKEPEKKPLWRRPASIIVSALAVIILVLGVALVMKRGDELPVTKTKENSLAVLYFENLSDPEDSQRLGQILQELVIADLSEIASLKVFSSQRLFDIQKQLGSRDRRKIDPELATEVAQRAEAKTMLMGRLMQVGSKLILTSQLVDVLEGTIVGSQRTDGTDLYAMVDNLAVQIHNDLNLPATKLDRVDVAVKEKTTSSTEAYQYYLAGGDLLNESKFDSAIVQFKKAISIDSTFNQAYYKMAIAQWWSSAALGNATDEQAEESLSHILTSDRQTTHKQKLLTEGALALVQDRDIQAQSIFQQVVKEYPDEKEAWYGLGEAYFHGTGENLKSLDAFERALKLDPEFKLAYRHIFDIYYNEELFDRGIDRFRQFVTYYPSESQGYRYLGSMYRAKGEFDLAIENYQKAIENNPKDYKPKELLGLTYNLMGQYDKAVKKYHELFRPEVPLINQYYGKRFLSFVYAEQGQFRKAIEVMEESQYIGKSISIDREGNAVVWLGTLHFRLGDIEAAMSLFDSALVIDQSIVYLLWANSVKGAILARLGDQEALSTIIDEVQDRIEVKGVESEAKYAYNALLTEHFHLQGEIERALMELNNVKHSKAWADWLLHKEAMLHLENRSFDKAIDLSHDMQSPNVHGYSRFFNYPLGFYVRGRAYEAMGDLDLARENYEALLSLWQDGDEEIPERQDAIKRLSRIIKVQG